MKKGTKMKTMKKKEKGDKGIGQLFQLLPKFRGKVIVSKLVSKYQTLINSSLILFLHFTDYFKDKHKKNVGWKKTYHMEVWGDNKKFHDEKSKFQSFPT